MVIAIAGMNSLLAKLTALLGEEYMKHKSVRRKIASARDELSSMNALLLKLADVQGLDPQLKEWRNNVRELAYDMEDCIDALMHKLAHGGQGDAKPGAIKKMARKMERIWARHRVAGQIEELTARVKEVSERRCRYKLDESIGRSGTTHHVAIDPRLPVLLAESKGLVGVDGPRDVIAGWLMDGEPQLKVVSIVGFGGLGKTTLAMEVYRSLGAQIHYKASTSVSRTLDLKRLTKDILSQLLRKEYGSGEFDRLEVEQLIRTLRDYLQDKRYLIVIDDVWSTSDWGLVKSILPQNRHHSRVITTTRISSVAQSCSSDSQDLIYEIKHLNSVDSRRLFMRRIFQPEHDDCPSQLEDVSNAILKKCGGLPLAIITISSLLSTKLKIREQWELVKDGIGSAREEASAQMKNILLFSYNDLPYYLKPCLLYLSVFPEDYLIRRKQLIWKWIAEGLVVGERGQNPEESGEAYFNELINRSMIQPVGIQYDGKARACRLHDVLLDILTALSAEENFATAFSGYGAKDHLGKIRRLCLHHSDNRYTEDEAEVEQLKTTDLVHVRSFHAFGSCEYIFAKLDCPAMRVLDLERCSLRVQIKSIHKCLQLRYLNLIGADITEVPEEIGNLRYLETMDLRGRSLKGKLPPAMGQLTRLKHLFLSDDSVLPGEITNLRALQVLWMLTVNSVKLVEWLGELKELRELYMGSIKPNGADDDDLSRYNESFATSLRELGRHSLRHLCVFRYPDVGGVTNPLDDGCFSGGANCSPVTVTPPMTSSTPLLRLSHLDTWVRTMQTRYLRCLGELPCLLFLRIGVHDFAPSERHLICSSGFRCLKEFVFDMFAPGGRIGMVFAPGAMPDLQTLRLFLRAQGTKGDHGVGDGFGLEHLSALARVLVDTNCDGATAMEVESFEATISSAVSSHPNHPRIELVQSRIKEREMLKYSNDDEEGRQSDNSSGAPMFQTDVGRRIYHGRTEHNIGHKGTPSILWITP